MPSAIWQNLSRDAPEFWPKKIADFGSLQYFLCNDPKLALFLGRDPKGSYEGILVVDALGAISRANGAHQLNF